MFARMSKIVLFSLVVVFAATAAYSTQLWTSETPSRFIGGPTIESVENYFVAHQPGIASGFSITIVESRSYNSGHDMDLEWQAVAQSMGHTATIVDQTALDNTDFFAATDILIVSSGVIDIPSNRRTTIQQFIEQGGPVYLQGEYLLDFQANQTFQEIVNALGGSFSWIGTTSGDLNPMIVSGTLSSTPNTVPTLGYFWYGCTGSGDGTIENFLTYGSEYYGFIFTPPNSNYGKVICDSDQDWIGQSESHPESRLLMENIIAYFYLTDVPEEQIVPTEFSLQQNYPNPFNARTLIDYSLTEPAQVVFSIYNLLGQRIETLFDGRQQAGEHSVNWDATGYSSGIYFYQLTSEGKTSTKRMTVVK